VYNSFKKKIGDGTIDLDTDSLKLMLVTSSYVADIDAHVFRSSVTNEVSGTGYTTGGISVGTVTGAQDNTNDRGDFTIAGSLTISTATITARAAVLYKSRGGASSADELIGYYDFGSDISATGASFVITFSGNSLLRIS
jgi:hypothetical protein